jgi:hypothetical protein
MFTSVIDPGRGIGIGLPLIPEILKKLLEVGKIMFFSSK